MAAERPREAYAHRCEFRFYQELNDFLPAARRQRSFEYHFTGKPTVKDAIQALGVPQAEVDLILVDGDSVDFGRHLCGGERVAVYPVFERLALASLQRLRPAPLREPRFVLDVHLGKLARWLRLAGFDSLYRNDYDDDQLIALSLAERRILLTRDLGILKHNALSHGLFVRQSAPRAQLREIVDRLDLRGSMRPFSRCLHCNGLLQAVDKQAVLAELPPAVRVRHQQFQRCAGCQRLYWSGSHHSRLRRLLAELDGVPAPRPV